MNPITSHSGAGAGAGAGARLHQNI